MATATLFYTIHGFAIIFFIFFCGVWLLHVCAFIWSQWRLHRKKIRSPESPLPGVTVIKPLVGVDPNLSNNLETFFTQEYPANKFELLFCVHEKNDPAIEIVKELQTKYPSIDMRLFIGGGKVGVNPKINNMQPAYETAKYELVLISDSGIRMKADTLLDMALHMGENVGLVHQMPFTWDRKGFPSVIEKIYFGTAHARIYLTADMFGINCATGMSALMRKKLLDEAGGIKAFGSYLAEDYFFAKSITEKGWKLSISSQPAWQNSGLCDIQTFQARVSRWAKLRFAMVPTTMILEPFTECMLLGLCGASAAHILFRWDPIAVFLVHLLIWCIFDWILLRIVQNGSLPFTKFEYVMGWLFREVSAPFIYLHSLLFPNIHWRDGYYKLTWGGRVEEIIPKEKLLDKL